MENKSGFQENMEKWKSLSSVEEREKFLQQMKEEVAKKTPEEFKESLKEVHTATIELHKDVFHESSRFYNEKIIATPESSEDLTALEAFLKKMNIPFKKVG